MTWLRPQLAACRLRADPAAPVPGRSGRAEACPPSARGPVRATLHGASDPGNSNAIRDNRYRPVPSRRAASSDRCHSGLDRPQSCHQRPRSALDRPVGLRVLRGGQIASDCRNLRRDAWKSTSSRPSWWQVEQRAWQAGQAAGQRLLSLARQAAGVRVVARPYQTYRRWQPQQRQLRRPMRPLLVTLRELRVATRVVRLVWGWWLPHQQQLGGPRRLERSASTCLARHR